MTWKVAFSPDSYDDIRLAAEWYDTQRLGLGDEFVSEVRQTAKSLATDPLVHQIRNKTKMIRWARTDRFPYQCIYQAIESEKLVIIGAVMHCSRSGKAWRDRF
jgi:plasmid stabilization system protein ParE